MVVVVVVFISGLTTKHVHNILYSHKKASKTKQVADHCIATIVAIPFGREAELFINNNHRLKAQLER